MKRKMSVWIACILFLVAASPVFATTYYVATSGSDTNNGSTESPWATLQKAADTVVAGDTVIVKDGAYAGWHIYGKSGTSSSPITFRAENAGGVTLNAKPPKAAQNGIIELEGNASATSDYWVVDGFVVDGRAKTLMTVDCRWVNYCTFQNLTVYGSDSRGLYISHGNYNCTYNCTSHDNGEHGSYCANAGTYNTFRKNNCYSNASEGMQSNGDLSMGGNGLALYYVYEKNVIYNNRDKGLNFDGCCNSTFRNNLLYGNAGGGIALFSIDAAKGSSDDLVYNNTVVASKWCIQIPSSKYNGAAGPDPVGHKIRNNILCSSGSGSIWTYSSTVSGLESDYNVVVDRFSVDNGDSSIDLAAWRKYGYDAHSIISNAALLFVNAASNDYHLKAGSPAIDAGTKLSEVTDDMDGNSRPQGAAHDIGCYEAVAGR